MDASQTLNATHFEALVAGFMDHSLPAERWTHQAHLIVGLHFAYHYPLEQAIYYLRTGIITYNVATGGKNTPERGYHETITQFWAKWLHLYVQKHAQGQSFEATAVAFLQSEWAAQEIMLQFYSKERLFSTQARSIWVEPDLQDLA